MRHTIVIAIIVIIGGGFLVNLVTPCKEALCASVISKCLLIDACKCDVINCTCCKDCFQCLGALFADCCECVDMCPKTVSAPSNLSTTSHVEVLTEPLPELFAALTDEHDATGRWTAYTYTIYRDLSPFLNPTQLQNIEMGMVSKDGTAHSFSAVNCTVAFMAQCMPWNKCKNSCRSMGASSYRWFHDGCCECVGQYCLNYGMNDTRCLNCPKINGGTMDDEYELPEDDDRPRKHVETTENSSQEINVEEKSVRRPTEAPRSKPKPKPTTAPSVSFRQDFATTVGFSRSI